MTEVPGAIKTWTQEIAYELVGAQRLLIRLPPRMGKTYLMKQIETELGPSAVYVDGAAFSEANQAALREKIKEDVRNAISIYGAAQLLFDSFDRAVARTQGARLQAALNALLVDGADAKDIGAIFTARCSTVVERGGAGSPLMSRVKPVEAPTISSDLLATGNWSSAEDWFGDAALLATRAGAPESFDPTPTADRIEQDLSYLKDVRGASAASFVLSNAPSAEYSYATRSAAYGLIGEDGPTQLFRRIESLLTVEAEPSPAWPADWRDSIARFVKMIEDATEAIWVDRYMYRDVDHLRRFLTQVAKSTQCQINLLGYRNIGEQVISKAEMTVLSRLSNVTARFITDADYFDLHDRHLHLGSGGWVIPQVHVIVGKQAPGSAVAVPTPSFGVDYGQVWQRSTIP